MKRKIQGETQGIFSIQFGGDYIPNRLKEDLLKNQLTILESFFKALWSSR